MGVESANNETMREDELPPSIGARLSAARIQRELELESAAAELGLDPATLRALEADDFRFLGAPVFVRAHLARYAGLLRLGADVLLADYARLGEPAPELPPASIRREPMNYSGDKPRRWWWLGALATVVALIVLASWRLWEQPAVPLPLTSEVPGVGIDGGADMRVSGFAGGERGAEPRSALATIQPRVMPINDPRLEINDWRLDADSEAVAGAEVGADPLASRRVTAEAAVRAGAEEPPPLADDDDAVRLELAFTAECWTEITDAVGRRLYFGLARPGETARLRGEPPLQVLLGDTSAVHLQVDGEPHPLPADEGRVTRLQLASRLARQ